MKGNTLEREKCLIKRIQIMRISPGNFEIIIWYKLEIKMIV